MMRTVLAAVVGVIVTVVIALIVGEYPFVGLTPYLAAVLVPAVIATAVVWTGDRHPALWWAVTGVLSGAGIGWAVWISTGRGVDPTPIGGWLAIGLSMLWPLTRSAWLIRHRQGPDRWSRPAPTPGSRTHAR